MIIDLRNTEVIEKLEYLRTQFSDICTKHNTTPEELLGTSGDNRYRTSEEVLRSEYLPRWRDHSGFPDEDYQLDGKELFEKLKDQDAWKLYNVARHEMTKHFNASANALFSWYPPNGFIGWHTNWNTQALQVLFTWSETGEGYFQYYDKKEDKVVVVPDKKGWSAKTYVFGPKEDLDDHFWHSAYTPCNRMTLCYKVPYYGKDRLNLGANNRAFAWRDDFIDYLEESL
jgi:hypothetical protein